MDGYLQKEQLEKQAMLHRENKYLIIILVLLLMRCNIQPEIKQRVFEKKSKEIIKEVEYYQILHNLCDSVKTFVLFKLSNYEAERIYKYEIDSLLCFNSAGNRFISCRHLYDDISNATSDDLQFILGEKINGQWYFFKTASIVIPRSMVKDHPLNKSLSYAQLHEIALKEVYGGYLNKKGEINEAWFTEYFEGGGWGQYPETMEDVAKLTRKDYEKRHLEKVANNWYGVKKDSVKQLQASPNL